MKLLVASEFCIPETPPVHTVKKCDRCIRFLLRNRVEEKCADLHKAFHLCFVPGWRHGAVRGVPLSTSTERANYKRVNHGQSRLFQDAVPSVSSWLQSFPVCRWWTRALSSVSGPPIRWRCIRGWLMRMLWVYEHDFAAISPFPVQSRALAAGGLVPSAATSSGLSCSSRGPPAGALGDLRVTARASPPSTSPRTSYSSRSEHPVRFLGDFAGSSHGALSM